MIEKFKEQLAKHLAADDPTTINDVGYYLRLIDSVDRDIARMNIEKDKLEQLRVRCLQKLSIVCDHKPNGKQLRCPVCHRITEESGAKNRCSHCRLDLILDRNEKLTPLLKCNAASGDDRCFNCPVCFGHIHQKKPTSL